MRHALTTFGYKPTLDTVYQILGSFDDDMKGFFDFSSFVDMCSTHKKKTQHNKNKIYRIFLQYDKGRKGYFDINDLKRVSKELGEETEDEMLMEMIKNVDMDMDGRVSFQDFYNAMKRV